jgi:hypothetical protein
MAALNFSLEIVEIAPGDAVSERSTRLKTKASCLPASALAM